MARPKVILQVYPMFPTKDEDERKAKRPLGRDASMYQWIVHEWLEILKTAEDLGVWGAATIEHHLHSEGYEVGPNPGVLNAWWAGQLKKMHVGAIGYVMATQDPIRIAEETAILDHLTKGRYFVGLARGYQSRWTNILGQFTDSVATLSDGSAADQKNRDIFEERVDMLLKCWENDSVVLDGSYYKAPYPSDRGIADYPAREITRSAGAVGEVDDEGVIRRISVVPAPYQRPHPPVLVATNKSDESIRYCARKGFIPTYFTKFETLVKQSEIYVQECAKNGRVIPKGAGQNIVRWVHFSESEAQYDQKLRDYELDIFKNFYSAFFPRFADPNNDWISNIKETGLYIGGTVEQVRAEWQRMFRECPTEYITLVVHYAQQPKDDVLKMIKTFMEEIVPYLDSAETPIAAKAGIEVLAS